MEQFHHPRPVCSGHHDRLRPTPEREQLMAGLTGTVLEIGAGDGVKLACYPPAVAEIILIEPDGFLRAAAGNTTISTPLRIITGDLDRLPVADGSCDAVICSLVLCCSRRPERALEEIRRALRPGGRLRFYEHQRSPSPLVAMAQTLVTPIWSPAAGGCRPARDTVAAIERAGFVIEKLARFSYRRIPHVLGTARPHS
ncbi:class I SAM-dependent methyltransferase [Herbidospora daliensis]|uniref:class I SAM-dependent methyltransferase n=1 Tax=Herbidospora daliensis TaxID=295585 RepID=UPI000785CCCB|nr:class I SAM-dependent methyltransferase [Herbidospora daliensis]